MAYPLIILGAGASYDSIDIEPHTFAKKQHLDKYRPPLTNLLFDHSREIFQQYLEKYPRVNSLSGGVLSRLADNHFTFEEILQSLLDTNKVGATGRQERVIRELIALSFYLSDLFYEISNQFYEGDNNYIRLINEIHNKLMNAYVINFNYDLVFERSASKDLSSLDSYMNGFIKILKIHGACNWVYEPVTIMANTYNQAQDYFSDKADDFFDFFIGRKILIDKPDKYIVSVKDNVAHAYMPAIALPFNKKTLTVCPANHLEDFKSSIDSFDRVIIIGWRGTDEFITNLLKEKLGDKKLSTFVISFDPNVLQRGNDEIKKAKESIRNQYSDIPQLIIQDENIFLEGFSKFMKNYSNYSRVLEVNLPAIF